MTNIRFTDEELTSIFRSAYSAAKLAEQEYAANNPWYPCGFAWIEFKDSRKAINKQILRLGFSKKSHSGSGTYIWGPGGTGTQSMYAKEAGCEAFKKVLDKHGIECSIDSRMD